MQTDKPRGGETFRFWKTVRAQEYAENGIVPEAPGSAAPVSPDRGLALIAIGIHREDVSRPSLFAEGWRTISAVRVS